MIAQISGFLFTPSAGEVLDFAGRAAIALLLGALIGVERQWHQRMAGLRTNALVSLGAALFVLFGDLLGLVRGVDPTRIAAYVVSGIGFLGAGVILRYGANVRGINTAATVWCSAAVGILAGGGYVVEAIIAALFVVAAHGLLRPVARRIDHTPATDESEIETVYTFRTVCQSADEPHIRALVVQTLAKDEFRVRAIHSEDLNGGDLVEVEAEFRRNGREDMALETAVSRLCLEPSVSTVEWNITDRLGAALASEP